MTNTTQSGPYLVEYTDGMYFINGPPNTHRGPWDDPAGAEDWCAQLNAAYHHGANKMRERCAVRAHGLLMLNSQSPHWPDQTASAIRALPLVGGDA